METRFQRLFLIAATFGVTLALSSAASAQSVKSEAFDFGVTSGLVNIPDFPTEPFIGASATIQAAEDFFLQFNYAQARSEPSAYERNQGLLFDGRDRDFRHYDLLLGYKLLQGEFLSPRRARLSSLYVVGGVGELRFGAEQNFATTLGVGYELGLSARTLLRVDYRAHLYRSALVSDIEQSVSSHRLSAGLSYRF
jgi:outer membrane beta-barrel protein